MAHKACFGLFRLCVILRLFWYSASSVAADKPLPILLVNLVILSVIPKTVFLAKLVAPYPQISREVWLKARHLPWRYQAQCPGCHA